MVSTGAKRECPGAPVPTVVSPQAAQLFRDLPEAAFAAVTACGHPLRLRRGQVAFVRGDRADAVYVVLHGYMKLVRTSDDGAESILRLVPPGDLFGSPGYWGMASYCATAVALIDAVVLRFATPDFEHLLASQPDFARGVIRLLGRQMVTATARLHELQTESAEHRIARALLRLADTMGTPTAAGIAIGPPLSRQHVAELTGTALSTASRVLSGWERQGVLRTARQRITIAQPAALAAPGGDVAAPVQPALAGPCPPAGSPDRA